MDLNKNADSAQTDPVEKEFRRTKRGRMLTGVCSGAGEYFGIDPNLVRLGVAAVAVFSAGTGILAYLAAWLLIPEEGAATSLGEDLFTKAKANEDLQDMVRKGKDAVSRTGGDTAAKK